MSYYFSPGTGGGGAATNGPWFLDSTRGYACCAWFNPDFPTDANYHAIFVYGAPGSANNTRPMWLGVGAFSGTNYCINSVATNNGTNKSWTTSTVAQNNWYFAVSSVQGITTTLYAWHYTGGTMVPMATTGATGTPDADAGSYNFFFGRESTNTFTQMWKGQLFGVFAWRCALSQAEAQAMAFGASPRTIRPQHIIGDWDFNMGGISPANGSQPFQVSVNRGWGSSLNSFVNTDTSQPGFVYPTPPGPAGLFPLYNNSVYGQNWDSRLPIISQSANRPFPAPLQSFIAAPPNPRSPAWPPFQLKAY